MTLVQLRQFATLARAGSFVRASGLLHMTQPALSRSIKALEEDLGQLLFDRVGKRIVLTRFGQEVLQKSELLLEDAAQLQNSGKVLGPSATGRLRLGLSSGPGAMLTEPVMLHFARHFPRFHLDVVRSNTLSLAQMLRDRHVDAVVVDLRSLPPAPDLRVEQVVESTGAFLCRRGHPLAKASKVSFAQLTRFPIASTPLSDELARILVERYGERAHPQVMVTLTSDEIAHVQEVALKSDTVALAIQDSCPRLVQVKVSPALNANARFGLVTLANRAPAIYLPVVRELIGKVFG